MRTALILMMLVGCLPEPTIPTGVELIDRDGDGSPEGVDCDDGNAAVRPGTLEIYGDDIDNDCDTHVDEVDGNTTGYVAWYPDLDGDGYGDESAVAEYTTVEGADDPPVDNYVDFYGDCDDDDASINPKATEVCDDGIDNNCDGDIDEYGCIPSQEEDTGGGFGVNDTG